MFLTHFINHFFCSLCALEIVLGCRINCHRNISTRDSLFSIREACCLHFLIVEIITTIGKMHGLLKIINKIKSISTANSLGAQFNMLRILTSAYNFC